jgi:diacylglycerol kinase (ATP)
VDRILLVSNVQAGSADDASLAAAARILRSSVEVEVRCTSTAAELGEVLRHRAGRVVVVAGGDGTLHSAVAALHRCGDLDDAVLGLIPLGTGNDFARSIDVPLDPEEAAHLVLDGGVRKVDLIMSDPGDVVVNNVHVGVGVEASRQAAKWKDRLGRVGYAVGLVHAAFRAPSPRLRVEIDGTVVSDGNRPVLSISLGNGQTVGGGLVLNPMADPESGHMDVMLAFSAGRVERLGYGIDILRSRHLERPDAIHRWARSVSIAGTDFYCTADGEVQGPHQERRWEVASSALAMILPPVGGASLHDGSMGT